MAAPLHRQATMQARLFFCNALYILCKALHCLVYVLPLATSLTGDAEDKKRQSLLAITLQQMVTRLIR
jgi:hypothetical protein